MYQHGKEQKREKKSTICLFAYSAPPLKKYKLTIPADVTLHSLLLEGRKEDECTSISTIFLFILVQNRVEYKQFTKELHRLSSSPD